MFPEHGAGAVELIYKLQGIWLHMSCIHIINFMNVLLKSVSRNLKLLCKYTVFIVPVHFLFMDKK